ncbi:MAG: DEAD/DEAH box helicase, partial [Acidimicrobiales bacterium]
AAPTGSGKTVVAEYAVALALTLDQRVFYTSPLKALSNQKYADLTHKFGSGRVGLMTGDNVVRPDAPVVVMTTEILRNMIYERPQSLDDVAYVVLDEVHYLQDQYRGAVWEEVLIHCPRPVRLVCLSATVSNAEEFGAWMSTVRGEVEVIIEEERPIRLSNLYMVKDRGAQDPQLLETFVDGEPNRRGLARDKTRGMRHSRARAPRRSEVIQSLGRSQMLPAIYFIFSRAACDAAVKQCLGDGIRLNGSEDRLRMRKLAESHVESLSDSDLGVLGYQDWLEAAESGLASHHAGLVPPFKEAVEEGFKEGLIKVVFATETLSLGVNMPARAVVIEKLIKFNGRTKELLTAGEYTQLTGRAGRRGLDDEGFAVVLWSPQISFHQTAGLAGARSYALRSSFRPTYNMVANLVRRYPSEMAHELLNLSFAQYQTDALVVSLQLRLDDARRTNKESEAHRLARRLSGRKESLSKQLDTILDLLDLVGFVQGWNLTGSGYQLASIYHETDLLIAQCLGDGLLDSLDPPDLAGLVSVFTFESRQRSGSPLGDQATGSLGGSEGSHGRGRALGDQVWARWEQVQARAERLGTMERRFGLPPTR